MANRKEMAVGKFGSSVRAVALRLHKRGLGLVNRWKFFVGPKGVLEWRRPVLWCRRSKLLGGTACGWGESVQSIFRNSTRASGVCGLAASR